MELKDNQYINIPSFARTILDLSGNELIAYSLIHGFSQDGKSVYKGGLQYIADWCGLSSKIRAKEVIDRLINKGFIEKEETIINGVKFVSYKVTDTGYLKEIRGVSERDTNIIDNNNPSITLFDNKLSHKDNICSPNNVDEKFEEFWNTYGKKVERAQAIRMWNRLTVAQKDEVLSRVKIYVASKPDVQYRLNPATYLNPANQRWLDDIIPNNGSQSGKPKSNVFFA